MTAADKIAEAPQRIFAEMEPYDFPGYSPAWVWHSAGEPIEEPGGVVAYVRSDLADAQAQENARLKATIRALDLALERSGYAPSSLAREAIRAALGDAP